MLLVYECFLDRTKGTGEIQAMLYYTHQWRSPTQNLLKHLQILVRNHKKNPFGQINLSEILHLMLQNIKYSPDKLTLKLKKKPSFVLKIRFRKVILLENGEGEPFPFKMIKYFSFTLRGALKVRHGRIVYLKSLSDLCIVDK